MSNYKGQITFDENVLQYVKYSRETNHSILNDRLVKSYDDFGSLLHYAAFNNNTAVVRQLIALGNEVDLVGQDGQTPFMVAVGAGDGSITLAKLFLEAKASMDVLDDDGRSVLQRALGSFDCNSPLTKLFASKIKTKRTTAEALATRLIAAGCKMFEAATLRNVEVMQCMLDLGVDVNSASRYWNRTALHRAAEMNDLDIANWLVKNGADVNARDKHASSVVHLAASLRRKDVLKFLLERGADPNYKNSFCEFSPLVAVCVNRDEVGNVKDGDECVKLLLQHGAVLEKSLGKHSSIFDYALDTCSNKTVKMLIGQLAILELLGKSITKEVMFCKVYKNRSKLPKFEEFRKLCLQVLTTKLVADLSLFDLLTLCESRFNSMVRRKIFASNVKTACSKQKLSKSHYFYYDTLMMRIEKADRIMKLQDKAILVMCKLFRCTYNQCHYFAREIVSYLNGYELERLIQV